METQGIAGKLDFRGRKRGVDAAVGKAQKADAAPVQAPAAAPAAKKRRAAKQPTMKQVFSAAVAASGAAQACGGIAAQQLSGPAAEAVYAAHARARGEDNAERLSGGSAEAPQTQPQAEELHAAPIARHARAAASPLAAAHAGATSGPIVFEHEAVDTSDDEDADDADGEPSALAELAARVNALKRAMAGCERVRLACVAGSAKARAAARQRDELGAQIAALARVFTPEGMSDDEEAEHAPAVAADAC